MKTIDDLILESRVAYHLKDNHYPPYPSFMVDVAIKAIERARSGSDLRIRLPKGITFKGKSLVFPSDIIESLNLSFFLE